MTEKSTSLTKLADLLAKRCLTASGYLWHQQRVLLLFHRKLNLWLAPGGHVEVNELPHQAAEREFWEETGVRVRVIDPRMPVGQRSQFLPAPIICNLHWVSEANYLRRVDGREVDPTDPFAERGCEQHLNFGYALQLVDDTQLRLNRAESKQLKWFTSDELKTAPIHPDIMTELRVVEGALSSSPILK